MKQESIPVWLAKESLRYFMAHSSLMPEPVDMLESELMNRAGVFVSLKRQGRLRGCIGTILPTQTNAAREIIRNAVSAATADPRFSPVQKAELDELEVSVDILSAPERIDSAKELDPKHYGIIVRHGSRSGVLLPNLEGIETVADQIAIACQKADIGPDEPLDLYRFEVTRYH